MIGNPDAPADGKNVLAGTSDGYLHVHPILDIMLEIFEKGPAPGGLTMVSMP